MRLEHQTTFDEARYRPVLSRQSDSPTLRDIWASAYGDEYPAEVEPLGFTTVSGLERVAAELEVGPGETFVDLGCGRGGPGLWLARRTGASVVGVDIVPEAVEQAARRSEQFGVTDRASFLVGSFTSTGLPDAAFHGAVSIDSLWMVLDKSAAIEEVARILSSGSRWVCTTWQPSYFDYASLMTASGFAVLVCEEPSDWRGRQLAVYEGIVREERRLIAELGDEAARVLLAEARDAPRMLDDCERLLIVVRRP